MAKHLRKKCCIAECGVKCVLGVAVGRHGTSLQVLWNDSLQGCPRNWDMCAGSMKMTVYCDFQRTIKNFPLLTNPTRSRVISLLGFEWGDIYIYM